MGKENEKEIGKEFQHKFLPTVKEKTIGKILRELENNPGEFILKTFNQMERDNTELGKFLLGKSHQYPLPSLFYLGIAFVYQSLFKELKKKKMPFPQVSRETLQDLIDEIETAGKIYLKKQAGVAKGEFQEFPQLDSGILLIDEDNLPKLRDALTSYKEKQKDLIKGYERDFKSIIPSPTFYSEENPILMNEIEKNPFHQYLISPDVIFQFPNSLMGKCQTTGAMYTYELLRRQAETDYLEKEFQK